MCVQHLLDFTRVHVVAAADDEVLDPVDDAQIPVRIDLAQIPRAQPAVRVQDAAVSDGRFQ